MSIRPPCLALMLMLCLVWSGCSPTPETQLDEQKNPHYLAGMEKLGALDYKGAIESFERAVEDNPRSVLAHFQLGVLFEQHENDYAAALYHYNKAVKLRPSGYPADNIRQRIPACKQELVKADSLAVINPAALRETERLREENAALRRHLELLQAHLAARSAGAAGSSSALRNPRDAVANPGGNPATDTAARVDSSTPRSPTAGSTERMRATTTTTTGRARTHTVKAGDTATSISRQYSVKVGSLLSANPGLDPRRMRIGQVLNIPAS